MQLYESAEVDEDENREQLGMRTAAESSSSRFYTEEYLQCRKGYLHSYRAHFLDAEDRMNSELYFEHSEFMQRVEQLVQREGQYISLVEGLVQSIIDIWTAYNVSSALLRTRGDVEFSHSLENEYYFMRSDVNDITNFPEFNVYKSAFVALGHLHHVRYVPASDLDDCSHNSDSSIRTSGDDYKYESARRDELWEKSDLSDVYLESHRAACGFCLVDFEEPVRITMSDSAMRDFTSGGAHLNGETQRHQPPAPLIQLPCRHVFHKPCLILASVNSDLVEVSPTLQCPICRRDVYLATKVYAPRIFDDRSDSESGRDVENSIEPSHTLNSTSTVANVIEIPLPNTVLEQPNDTLDRDNGTHTHSSGASDLENPSLLARGPLEESNHLIQQNLGDTRTQSSDAPEITPSGNPLEQLYNNPIHPNSISGQLGTTSSHHTQLSVVPEIASLRNPLERLHFNPLQPNVSGQLDVTPSHHSQLINSLEKPLDTYNSVQPGHSLDQLGDTISHKMGYAGRRKRLPIFTWLRESGRRVWGAFCPCAH